MEGVRVSLVCTEEFISFAKSSPISYLSRTWEKCRMMDRVKAKLLGQRGLTTYELTFIKMQHSEATTNCHTLRWMQPYRAGRRTPYR